jgi:hypothetical protein
MAIPSLFGKPYYPPITMEPLKSEQVLKEKPIPDEEDGSSVRV